MATLLHESLESEPIVPQIHFDPCFAIDIVGLWATARIVSDHTKEIEVLVTVVDGKRHVEVGQDEDSIAVLGWDARKQILAALDEALEGPMRLVVDPRTEPDREAILVNDYGTPKEWVVEVFHRLLGATGYEIDGPAFQFHVPRATHHQLFTISGVVFGEAGSALFPIFWRLDQ